MHHLSTSAIAMLAGVWTIILINVGYCFFRLMTSQRNLGGGE